MFGLGNVVYLRKTQISIREMLSKDGPNDCHLSHLALKDLNCGWCVDQLPPGKLPSIHSP